MANIFTTHNTVYTPMSYEELVAPFIRYKENFDKDTNTLSEYQSNAEKWKKIAEGEAPNDEGYTLNMWNSYNNHLNDIADELMTKGRTMNTIPNILSLKKRYNSEILPIESAYAKREAMKDYELKNPDFIYQRNANDISLKDIIENPNMNYTNESKKNIYDRAKDQYKAIGEAFNEFASSGYRDTGIPFVKEAYDRYGITPKQLANAIEGRADSSVYGKIMKMVEDRIFEGTNVYKWTKETDPLRPDYTYEGQEKMARDIIRSAMPEALGKIQRRQLTDQYGLNLALEREKKKLENEGKTEPTYTARFDDRSFIVPGYNNDINQNTEDVKNINLNGREIEHNGTPIKGVRGHNVKFDIIKNNGDVMSFDEFIKNNRSKFNDSNVTPNIDSRDENNMLTYYEQNRNQFVKYYNDYIENVSKELEGLGIKHTLVKSTNHDQPHQLLNFDGDGRFNINSSKNDHIKENEEEKVRAYYNIKNFAGADNWTPADAFNQLANTGSLSMFLNDQDSTGELSLGMKEIKTINRKTKETEYVNEPTKFSDVFQIKDGKIKPKKDKFYVNNIGLKKDGSAIFVQTTDGEKLSQYEIPLQKVLENKKSSLYNKYRQLYNRYHNEDYKKKQIRYFMEIGNKTYEQALDLYNKAVYYDLDPILDEMMVDLFVNKKIEPVKIEY